MSIDWISVDDRVPDNRRTVLVYGFFISFAGAKKGFLGTSKYNRTKAGGKFDNELRGRFSRNQVTHWAEITEPANAGKGGE